VPPCGIAISPTTDMLYYTIAVLCAVDCGL
jgi:hypothetical protein